MSDHSHPAPTVVFRVHQGLLAWDAGFYESIARFGYAPFGHQALRFFPLFPLVARALAQVPGISDSTAIVLIANLGALVGTALLVVLVRRETGDASLARRSAWLMSLAPPAFTLVLGYAEGMLLVFTVGCFLCLRPAAGKAPVWWGAAVLGLRRGAHPAPRGAALRRGRGRGLAALAAAAGGGERLAMLLAAAAPAAGLATFLGWSAAVYGDFWLPLRVQTSAGHHGGLDRPGHDPGRTTPTGSSTTTWAPPCTSRGSCWWSCCWWSSGVGCPPLTGPSPPPWCWWR